MRYVSTRGRAPELGFADVLLAGLATDGGLYVPAEWPPLPRRPSSTRADVRRRAPRRSSRRSSATTSPPATSRRMCDDAYATFRHPAVVPLVQIDDRQWLAELFHGPTLAFKDVALQLVGRLFDHVLGAARRPGHDRRRDQRRHRLGGDRGVKDCAHVDIVILYPAGGTSEVQRRQMTTVDAPNVRAVAIEGTFDDCQDLVKAMFNDAPFRERMRLSAVNSINWARVMAQVVYYVTRPRALGGPITACVPTGNFGNVFAGWVARRMGAPIDGLRRSPPTPTTSSPASSTTATCRMRRRRADAQPEHGHPGVVELRAAAVRDERRRRRCGPASSCMRFRRVRRADRRARRRASAGSTAAFRAVAVDGRRGARRDRAASTPRPGC